MKQDTLVIVMLLISATILGGLFFSTQEATASGSSSSLTNGRYSVATMKISEDNELILVADNLTQKLAVYGQDIRNRAGVKMIKNPISLKKAFNIR